MSDDIDFDYGDDMMDGFDDFDSFDNPSDDEGARNPIMNVAAGALDRATDVDTGISMARTIVKNGLPKGFGVALDSADDTVGAVSDIYESTMKDLKGPIKDLKKLVNGSIESATWLPKGVRDKIKASTESEEETYSERVDPRELEIQEASNRIFAAKALTDAETSENEAKSSAIFNKAQVTGTSQIVSELRKLNGYNQATMSEYQRKDLELQFRQYYALKDLVEDGRASTVDISSYLEAIKTNTGLPDIQKTLASEEYKQAIMDKMTGSFGDTAGDFLNSFGGEFKKNIVTKVKDIGSQIGDFIGMATDLKDVSEDLGDMSDAEKEGLIGGEIAGMTLPFIGEEASKRLFKILKNNPKLAEHSNNLIYLTENYPQVLTGWLNSKARNSEIAENILDMVPVFGGSDISIKGAGGSDLYTPAVYSNMTDNSINVVIPGYLSRILQQQQKLTDNLAPDGTDPDLLSYSVANSDFESATVAKNRALSALTDSGNTKQSAFDSILSKLDPKGELSKGERERLSRFLLDASADNDLFNVSDIAKKGTGDERIDKLFSDLSQKGGDIVSGLNLDISRDFKRLSGGFKEASGKVNQMFSSGQRGVLEDMGLITTDRDGNITFNNDRLRKDMLKNLDLNKKYVDEKGQPLTGSRVLSDEEKEEAKRKELIRERKIRHGKKLDEDEEEDGLITRSFSAAKSTITDFASSTYENLSPEAKADLEKVRLRAKKEVDDTRAVIDAQASKLMASVKESDTYAAGSKLYEEKSKEFLATKTGKAIFDKEDGLLTSLESFYSDSKKKYDNGDYSKEKLIELATEAYNSLKDVNMSYPENKRRVNDLMGLIVENTTKVAKAAEDGYRSFVDRDTVNDRVRIQDIGSNMVSALNKGGLDFKHSKDIVPDRDNSPLGRLERLSKSVVSTASDKTVEMARSLHEKLPEDLARNFVGPPSPDGFSISSAQDLYRRGKDFVQSDSFIDDSKAALESLEANMRETVTNSFDDAIDNLHAEWNKAAEESGIFNFLPENLEDGLTKLGVDIKDEKVQSLLTSYKETKDKVTNSDTVKVVGDEFTKLRDSIVAAISEGDENFVGPVRPLSKGGFRKVPKVSLSPDMSKRVDDITTFFGETKETAEDEFNRFYSEKSEQLKQSNAGKLFSEAKDKVSNFTISAPKKLDLSQGPVENGPTLDEIMKGNSGSENSRFFETIKEEIGSTLRDAIGAGVGVSDYATVSTKLEEYLQNAKHDLMLNFEGFTTRDFVDSTAGKDTTAKPQGDAQSDVKVEPSRPLDVIKENVEGRVDVSGSLTIEELIRLSNAVKNVGKDVIKQFRMTLMGEGTDVLPAIPVTISGSNDTETPSSFEELVRINTEGFSSVFSALGEVNTSVIAAGVAGDNVPEGTRDVLLNSMGNFFGKVGKGTGDFFTSYFKGATKLTGSFFGGIGNVAGSVASGVAGGIASVTSSKQSDIYVEGSSKPAMLAKGLIAGDYIDVGTGKAVRNVEDVTGEVKDKDGNVVITEEEFSKGLFALDNGRFGSALKLVSSPFRLAFKAQANLIGAVLSVPKKILSTISGLFKKPYDVYVKGSDEPSLRAQVFKNNGYRSNNTGKLLSHPSDIDGEVADLNGNILVSNEDIKTGLVTRFGRPIDSSRLAEYSKKLIKGLFGATWGAAKFGFNTGMNIIKGTADIAGSGIKGAANAGLRALGLKREEDIVGSGIMGPNETLDKIYIHMQERWPVDSIPDKPEDTDGDGQDETDQKMIELQEELIAAVKDDKEPVKKRRASDTDGDGLRDGGWRDLLSRRKKKGPRLDKNGKPVKEEKTGIMGLIMTLIGAIGPLVTAIGTGFSALLGWLGLKKAADTLGGMGDGFGPDLDSNDKKKNKNKRPKPPKAKGRFGKLLQGAKNLGGKAINGVKGVFNNPAGKRAAISMGAKTAGKFLGKKAMMAGAGALAAGTLAAPVVLAAGVAYTVYEIGSFFAGRLDLEPLEKLRYLQYGIRENYSLISEVRSLESDLEGEVNYGKRPSINTPVDEVIKDSAEDFGVDMENQAQVADFAFWYTRRFAPVFMIHANAAHQIDDGVDITDIDDEMDGKDNKVLFVRNAFYKAQVLDRTKTYEITNTPMPGAEIHSNAQEIKDYAASLIEGMGGVAEKETATVTTPSEDALKAKGKKPSEVPSVEKAVGAPPIVSGKVETRSNAKYNKLKAKLEKRRAKSPSGIAKSVGIPGNFTGSTDTVPGKEFDDVVSITDGTVIKTGAGENTKGFVTVKKKDGTVVSYFNLSDIPPNIIEGFEIKAETVVGKVGKDGFSKRIQTTEPSPVDAKVTANELSESKPAARDMVPGKLASASPSNIETGTRVPGSHSGYRSLSEKPEVKETASMAKVRSIQTTFSPANLDKLRLTSKPRPADVQIPSNIAVLGRQISMADEASKNQTDIQRSLLDKIRELGVSKVKGDVVAGKDIQQRDVMIYNQERMIVELKEIATKITGGQPAKMTLPPKPKNVTPPLSLSKPSQI